MNTGNQSLWACMLIADCQVKRKGTRQVDINTHVAWYIRFNNDAKICAGQDIFRANVYTDAQQSGCGIRQERQSV